MKEPAPGWIKIHRKSPFSLHFAKIFSLHHKPNTRRPASFDDHRTPPATTGLRRRPHTTGRFSLFSRCLLSRGSLFEFDLSRLLVPAATKAAFLRRTPETVTHGSGRRDSGNLVVAVGEWDEQAVGDGGIVQLSEDCPEMCLASVRQNVSVEDVTYFMACSAAAVQVQVSSSLVAAAMASFPLFSSDFWVGILQRSCLEGVCCIAPFTDAAFFLADTAHAFDCYSPSSIVVAAAARLFRFGRGLDALALGDSSFGYMVVAGFPLAMGLYFVCGTMSGLFVTCPEGTRHFAPLDSAADFTLDRKPVLLLVGLFNKHIGVATRQNAALEVDVLLGWFEHGWLYEGWKYRIVLCGGCQGIIGVAELWYMADCIVW